MPRPTSFTPANLPGLVRILWQRREFRFLVVGGGNTVMAYGLFVLFHALLADKVGYLLLLVPTYAVGVPIAFTCQRFLVFDTHGNALVDFARYTLVQLTSIGLNAAVLALMVQVLGMAVVIAQMVAIVVVVVLTYFSHALFSFRRPAPVEPLEPAP
jgi:putative flippase GtrA